MRHLIAKGSLALAAAVALPAFAQTYPAKTIRIVVPASPGGAIDLAARLIGQKLTEAWGQPVVVDNKAGATGIIGTDVVAKAPPDGHMLGLVASSHAINPSMVQEAALRHASRASSRWRSRTWCRWCWWCAERAGQDREGARSPTARPTPAS